MENTMGYSKALEMAGATVLDFEMFGSYQGDWIAHVTLPDGRTGFIRGYFGSCSGCDHFEAEFGYEADACDAHRYDKQEDCAECQAVQDSYIPRLVEFGLAYFVAFKSGTELVEELQAEWEGELDDWVKARL